jgi:hypothetical protein
MIYAITRLNKRQSEAIPQIFNIQFRLVRVRLVNITYSIFVKKFFDKYPGMVIEICMNFAAEIIAG